MTITHTIEKALTPINNILEHIGQERINERNSLLFLPILIFFNIFFFFAEGDFENLLIYVYIALFILLVIRFFFYRKETQEYAKLCNRDLSTTEDLKQIYHDLTTFIDKKENKWAPVLLSFLMSVSVFSIAFSDYTRSFISNIYNLENPLNGNIPLWFPVGFTASFLILYLFFTWNSKRKYKKVYGENLEYIDLLINHTK